LYKPNGAWDAMPWLRGIPLEEETPGKMRLMNENILDNRKDLLTSDLNHFNIEKQPKIHAEITRQIMAVCVTRGQWAAMKSSPRPAMVTTPATRPAVGMQAMAE
jgi:hypothetical protein